MLKFESFSTGAKVSTDCLWSLEVEEAKLSPSSFFQLPLPSIFVTRVWELASDPEPLFQIKVKVQAQHHWQLQGRQENLFSENELVIARTLNWSFAS